MLPYAQSGGEVQHDKPWRDINPEAPGGRYLRRFWQPVCRSVDLGSSQPLLIPILGESWVLFRDTDGSPRLIGSTCPHRGTGLQHGLVVAGKLRCRHHGLEFNGNGGCADRDTPLRTRPTIERYGLIFGFYGRGAPPPPLVLPELEGQGQCSVLSPDVWPCSFFARLENTVDLQHVPATHALSGVGGVNVGAATITSSSGGLDIDLPIGALRYRAPNRLVFPVPGQGGWDQLVCFRVPIDAQRCVSFSIVPQADGCERQLSNPFLPSKVAELGQAIVDGERRLDDCADEPNLTEIEDYVVLVGADPNIDEPTERDEGVLALRTHWRRSVQESEADRDSSRQ